MTVDYHELNNVTLPMHAAVPSKMDLMVCLSLMLGKHHCVVDLANTFFSTDIALESQEPFAFTWKGQQWTFVALPQGYLHSPMICHGLVTQDLAMWKHTPAVSLFHYIRSYNVNF